MKRVIRNEVKAVRRKQNMTLEELAAVCGISTSTLSDIEHGAEPRVGNAIRLARALGTSVEEIWFV